MPPLRALASPMLLRSNHGRSLPVWNHHKEPRHLKNTSCFPNDGFRQMDLCKWVHSYASIRNIHLHKSAWLWSFTLSNLQLRSHRLLSEIVIGSQRPPTLWKRRHSALFVIAFCMDLIWAGKDIWLRRIADYYNTLEKIVNLFFKICFQLHTIRWRIP